MEIQFDTSSLAHLYSSHEDAVLGTAAPPGARPAAPLPREGAPRAHPSRGQGLTVPPPCSPHRKPPSRAATSWSPCQTPAGAAATTCRWGAGWDGVGKGQVGSLGGHAPPGSSTATAWGFPGQPPASPRQGRPPPPADGPPAQQPWRHPGEAGGFLVGPCPPASPPHACLTDPALLQQLSQ